jgi:Class III cytochrome C family
MRTLSRSAVVLIVLCQMLAGGGRTPSEERVKNESSEPQPAPSPQATFQVTAQATVLQDSPGKNAAAETTKALPKDVVILRGSPLGAVKFEHKLHSQARSIKCETCHHPSRSEKPATALQQACSACHTKVAIPPMKTKLQAAFHNPTATAGTCIDCHKAETAKGKVTPVKCLGCHKKENM